MLIGNKQHLAGRCPPPPPNSVPCRLILQESSRSGPLKAFSPEFKKRCCFSLHLTFPHFLLLERDIRQSQLRTCGLYLFCTKYVCLFPAALHLRPRSRGKGQNSTSGGRKSKVATFLSFPGIVLTRRHLSHANDRAAPNMINFTSVLLTWAY